MRPPVVLRVEAGAGDEEAIVQNVAVGQGGSLGEASGACGRTPGGCVVGRHARVAYACGPTFSVSQHSTAQHGAA